MSGRNIKPAEVAGKKVFPANLAYANTGERPLPLPPPHRLAGQDEPASSGLL